MTKEGLDVQLKAGTIPALRQVYGPLFDIGAAVNLETIGSAKELLGAQFNSLTAENDMKFERVHPLEDTYTFEAADRIVDFAAAHNMKVRGHTLVWHNQTPNWVFEGEQPGSAASRELLLSRMKSHIDTVVGRYKGIIYGWDVVNEAIEDKSELWLRQSRWLELVGEDFIDKAFRFAHEADPAAVLFYNDYNECNPEKRDKIVKLLQGLKERDVPVHGMGMQGHWGLNGPTLDEIRAAIEAYAGLGLQVQVTELDISVFDFEDHRTDLTAPTPWMVERQAERYEQIFRLFREYKEVITAVTFWGAADDYTWLHDFPVQGRRNWPFVFDENHKPKEAFWRLVKDL